MVAAFMKFLSETSCHGLQLAGRAKTKCRICFWLALSFVGVCFILNRIKFMSDQINDCKVFYATKVHDGPVPFPAVTVCNINPYMRSRARNIPQIAAIETISYNVTQGKPIGKKGKSNRRKRALDCNQYIINAGDAAAFQYQDICFVIEKISETSNIVDPTPASDACESKGGRLAWIEDEATKDAVRGQIIMAGVSNALTGLKQHPSAVDPADDWYFEQPAQFGLPKPASGIPWSPGEPNDNVGTLNIEDHEEDIGCLMSNNADLVDIKHYKAFVCEYEFERWPPQTTQPPMTTSITTTLDCDQYIIYTGDAAAFQYQDRCFVIEKISETSNRVDPVPASNDCESKGGRLAWIEDQATYDFVKDGLVTEGISQITLIGLQQVNDSPTPWANWYFNQPTQFGPIKWMVGMPPLPWVSGRPGDYDYTENNQNNLGVINPVASGLWDNNVYRHYLCEYEFTQWTPTPAYCDQYIINVGNAFAFEYQDRCLVIENIHFPTTSDPTPAWDACESKGGRLAWIEDQPAYDFVKSQMNTAGAANIALIGLQQVDDSPTPSANWYFNQPIQFGPKKWIAGMAPLPWAPGRPGDYDYTENNHLNLGVINPVASGLWDNNAYRHYLCEYEFSQWTPTPAYCDQYIINVGNAVAFQYQDRCLVIEHIIFPTTADPTSAWDACEIKGGRLAWIEDQATFDFVKDQMYTSGAVNFALTGLIQQDNSSLKSSGWHFQQPAQFGPPKPATGVPWHSGEPNDGKASDLEDNRENLGSVKTSFAGYVDIGVYQHFLCEYEFKRWTPDTTDIAMTTSVTPKMTSGKPTTYDKPSTITSDQSIISVKPSTTGWPASSNEAPTTVEYSTISYDPPTTSEQPTSSNEPPTTEKPTSSDEPPTTEKPTSSNEPPTTEKPTSSDEPPTTEKPTSSDEPPTTEKPTSSDEPPTTEKPTSSDEPPTTEKPTSSDEPPTSEKPTSSDEPPTTEKPTSSDEPPTTEKPTSSDEPPTSEKPTSSDEPPTTEKPTSSDEPPTTEKPTSSDEPPTTEKPTSSDEPPTSEKPTSSDEPPTTEKPTSSDEPPTTEKPTSSDEPPTTEKPTSSDEPPTTEKPTSSDEPPTGEKPTSSDEPSTTDKPTSSEEPLTSDKPTSSEKPMTTDKPTSSEEQMTTEKRTNSEEPPTTDKPTSSNEPLTTDKQTSSDEPPTTEKPTSSDEPPTTEKPTSSDEPPTTEKPTSSDEPPTTEKPTSSDEPPTGEKPTSSDEPSTTDKPTSSEEPLTSDKPTSSEKPMTTDKPTSSEEQMTTEKRTNSEEPPTTDKPTSSNEPLTTDKQTSSDEPPTTEKPTSSNEPLTTDKPTSSDEPPTTEKPTSSNEPSTTDKPMSSEQLSTTEKPTSSEEPPTTEKPTSSNKPSTTDKPTSSVEPLSTEKPSTTDNPTSSEEQSTAEKPTSSGEQSTTEKPTSSEEQLTTDKPTGSEEQSTTEKPTSLEEPPTTDKPTSSEVQLTTEKPTGSDEPPTTEKPTSSDEPPTTEKPTSSDEPPTGEKPTSSDEPSTTDKPTSSEEPLTSDKPTSSEKPMTTDKPTSSEEQMTTEKRTNSEEPPTTDKPTSSNEPLTTDKQTSSDEPPTTEKPTSSNEPLTTDKPTSSDEPPTTEKPTSSNEPSTTDKPMSSEQLSTTEKPTSSEEPPTTEKPTSSNKPSTTDKPTSSVEPLSTEKPSTTDNPTSSEEQSTAEKPTSSGEQSTTEKPTSSEEQLTTDKPTGSEEQSTTEKPTSLEEPPTTDKPTSSEVQLTTEKPTGSEEPPTTDKPTNSEELPTTGKLTNSGDLPTTGKLTNSEDLPTTVEQPTSSDEQSKPVEQPISSYEPPTTDKPAGSIEPQTTDKPTSSDEPQNSVEHSASADEQLTTVQQLTSSVEPPGNGNPTISIEPPTIDNPVSSDGPPTNAEQSESSNKPSPFDKAASSNEPPATAEQQARSDEPPTPGQSARSDEPSTTKQPASAEKLATSGNQTSMDKPPTRDNPTMSVKPTTRDLMSSADKPPIGVQMFSSDTLPPTEPHVTSNWPTGLGDPLTTSVGTTLLSKTITTWHQKQYKAPTNQQNNVQPTSQVKGIEEIEAEKHEKELKGNNEQFWSPPEGIEAEEVEQYFQQKEEVEIDVVSLLDENLFESMGEIMDNGGNDDFEGVSKKPDASSLASTLSDALPLIMDQIPAEMRQKLGIQKEEIFYRCTYDNKECNIKKWDEFAHPKYGNCFTFNNDGSRMVKRASGDLGLSIMLRLWPSQYLHFIENSGVVIDIHNPMQQSFPEAFGFTISGGKHTEIVLERQMVTKLQNCNHMKNATDESYIFPHAYSLEGCLQSCTQQEMNKFCFCMDPKYPPLKGRNDTETCPINKKACMDKFYKRSASLIQANCKHCEIPCNDFNYRSVMTQRKWPVGSSMLDLCPSTIDISDTAGIDKCNRFIEKEYLSLHINVQKTVQYEMQEKFVYTASSMVSQMGCWMSIMLGASVLTCIELVIALFIGLKDMFLE